MRQVKALRDGDRSQSLLRLQERVEARATAVAFEPRFVMVRVIDEGANARRDLKQLAPLVVHADCRLISVLRYILTYPTLLFVCLIQYLIKKNWRLSYSHII